MTVENFEAQITAIREQGDLLDVYSSGDFQCDASSGFPVTLNWSYLEDLAWIEPSWFLIEEQYQEALAECCQFGFHPCYSVGDFNSLLKYLDEEAFCFEYLFENPFEEDE